MKKLELLKDSLLVTGRIITIIPLLLFITLFMGKRAIGELPVFDFLIIVTLGAVVGADIADPSIHHFPTAVAIIILGIFQRIIANWKLSKRKFGKLITFEPTVVIQNGKFITANLKEIRYSVDNILQMLREKNVFDIKEVETAIIEPNGALSVLKKAQKRSVTLEDLELNAKSPSISFPVIIEGKVYKNVLQEFNVDEHWLKQQLAIQGYHNIKRIFFASVTRDLELHVSLLNERNIIIPPVRH